MKKIRKELIFSLMLLSTSTSYAGLLSFLFGGGPSAPNVPKIGYEQFSGGNLSNELNNIEDLYNVFDETSEKAFGALNKAGSAASSTLAAIGAAPTVLGTGAPGAAAAANTIETMLLKVNQVKARIDQLKQFKRILESLKGLNPEQLKTLKGVNNMLDEISGILNETENLKKNYFNYGKLLEESDLTSGEGWKNLNKSDEYLKGLNLKVYEDVAGENNAKIMAAYRKATNEIQNINAKTEKQELEKISNLLGVLISMTEKSIANTAKLGANELKEKEKKLDERIARNKAQQKRIEELNQYIDESRAKTSGLNEKFVGDIYGR